MTDEKQKTAAQPTDDDVTAIIDAGAAGVDTAIRALEATEKVYYGAVAAMESPMVVTTTAVSPYSPDTTTP